MRAIDADAFDERVRVAVGMSEEELTEDFKDGVQAVLYMLSNQPTIDVSTVDRQAAVDMLMERASNLRGIVGDLGGACSGAAKLIMQIPSAEPKIIYCKDCRKHNKKIGFDENFHTVWKEDACPLASWRGKAQGHEFDYQFCAYAERRTE